MTSVFRLPQLSALAVAVLLLTGEANLFGQQKQGQQPVDERHAKKSVAPSDAPQPAAASVPKRLVDTKTPAASLQVRDQANDYWTTCFGGFHMFESQGRAVYRFPASPSGIGYDTNWTFVDDSNVGTRRGWTYKEEPSFYMFFGREAEGGKYYLAYSSDNRNFTFYAWAD